MSDTPKNRDANASQRAALAVSLRAKKLTYEEVALAAGYNSASACRRAILRELDRVVVENVEELRKEEAAKLDRLEHECWERLEDENHKKAKLFAVDRIVAITELRMKLLGLAVKPDDTLSCVTIIREYGVEVSRV